MSINPDTTSAFYSILSYCRMTKPALIYLAVGCAQGHNGRDKATPQEYPPFVAEWPGNKVCILIDPMLEQIPYAFRDLGAREEETVGQTRVVLEHKESQVTFFSIRDHFETTSPPEWHRDREKEAHDMAFLYDLCDITKNNVTKLIYQDYSGRNIMGLCPPHLSKAVLFDVTYNDGGCFIDFDKIHILKDINGHFIQPGYLPLASPELRETKYLIQEMTRRKSPLGYFIHRYYQVLLGNKEARDWCSAEITERHMAPLCDIYGIPCDTTKAGVYRLLKVALQDFVAASGQYLTDQEMDDIIAAPDQYINSLKMSTEITV